VFREGTPSFDPQDALAVARARVRRISPYRVLFAALLLGVLSGLFVVALGSSSSTRSRLDGAGAAAADADLYVPFTVGGGVSFDGNRGVLPSPLSVPGSDGSQDQPSEAAATSGAVPSATSPSTSEGSGAGSAPTQAGQPEAQVVATGSEQAQMLDLINRDRVARGAPPLQADPSLTSTAAAHTQYMAESGKLCHTPKCNPAAQPDQSRFRLWGENIGKIDRVDVPALHKAFMQSPTHRTNLLNPTWRFVGIGWGLGRDSNGDPMWYTTVQFGV
jgi:uncharacterized protein YkwD